MLSKYEVNICAYFDNINFVKSRYVISAQGLFPDRDISQIRYLLPGVCDDTLMYFIYKCATYIVFSTYHD